MRDCLFCGIIDGSVNAKVVYQDDAVVAFNDIKPRAPVHILIIPRKHIASVLGYRPERQRADRPDLSSRGASLPASMVSRRAVFVWWSIPAPMRAKASFTCTTIYSAGGRWAGRQVESDFG